MSYSKYSRNEVVERGEAIYQQEIRRQIDDRNKGKFVVVDIETGDYELDADDLQSHEAPVGETSRSRAVRSACWISGSLHTGGHISVEAV